MKPILRTVQVSAVLPKPLADLHRLGRNLFWDWTPAISSLFQRIDPKLWRACGENPEQLLGQVDNERLAHLAQDIGFLSHLGRAREELDRYLAGPGWFQREHVDRPDVRVAYFSAEFGLAGCIPVYSGGLGVLAGDHLKSASDLGVPLVAIGLLYQEGYFRQYLNADGWQMESYPPNDFYNMPIDLARHPDGSVVTVSVEFPGRDVHAQVWRVDVGRVPLFLLDTNVPANSEADRQITRALYSGGVELRIQQLMVLGIGGFRALVAMDREPTVCHMNEGHAGFLGVERTRHLMQARGLSYPLARDVVDDGNIFTTHTPVPAGFDVFSKDLVERHMSAYIDKVGLSLHKFMALGRRDAHDDDAPLNMAILAIRHAVQRNSVSQLHGTVSRALVQDGGAWRDWPVDEVPIDAVTNGIHSLTWLAPEMMRLFDRYLGTDWRWRLDDATTWKAVAQIPGEELWRIHTDLRQTLVRFARRRLEWQVRRRGAAASELEDLETVLNPEALTIGFARRFATYKRATLLFSDLDRLAKIVGDRDRPVQFIFAGKAHPADIPAKELIKKIVTTLKEERFHPSIVFLEDYEINVAKHMVRGVDVWLNNPQRPKEASGTSGMKVVPNGGLNLSVLDGWWAEGYAPGLGWAIGAGEDHQPENDEVEANALYDLLETQVVPTFFNRDSLGVPRAWVEMMKASMVELAPRFSTDRMVAEYVEQFYLPTAERFHQRVTGDKENLERLLDWKRKVFHAWNDVRVVEIVTPSGDQAALGTPFEFQARIQLGALRPEEVEVQLYYGRLDAVGEAHDATTTPMQCTDEHEGTFGYRCELPFERSGRFGYTVRVIPSHPEVLIPNELEIICWAQQ